VSGATGGVRSLQHAAALRDGPLAIGAGADAVEAVLLAFEELASNGLRHGRPPVHVTVTAAGAGWLLEVSDAAGDRPPTPTVGGTPPTAASGCTWSRGCALRTAGSPARAASTSGLTWRLPPTSTPPPTPGDRPRR
jgi:two-component sensor histidine kinase